MSHTFSQTLVVGGKSPLHGRKYKYHIPARSPEYHCWYGMHERCENPKAKGYARYGGRGITVCGRWASFDNFYADMGLKPTPSHTIDRINNDGNYEPSNCRWATKRQQYSNMSIVKPIGGFPSIAEAARAIGVPYYRLVSRIKRGWSEERALLPIRFRK